MGAAADGVVLVISLLVRPSSWASRVQRDLGIGGDFSLLDLYTARVPREATASFLGRSTLGWLLVASSEGVLILLVLGIEVGDLFPALGVLLVLCLGGGLIVATCLSVAAALSGALVILAIFALGLVDSLQKVGSLETLNSRMAALPIPTGVLRGFAGAGERDVLDGLVISLGIGVVGFLAARPHASASIRPVRRVASATMTGIALSAGVAGSALFLAGVLREILPGAVGTSAALGVATAFCAACAILVHRGLLRPAVYAFLLLGLSWSVLAWFAFDHALPLAGNLALSSALRAAFFSSYFCVSYALASWVGGPWAGAFAAALGSGAAFAVRFGVEENPWVAAGVLSLKLLAVVLGLLLPFWLPLLSYPFELLWNSALFQVDRNRPDGNPRLLSLNSGLWNEHQYLRLYGLEEHLLLVLGRSPAAGARYVAAVRRGRQRWAAQAAELRVLAERLTGIDSVDELDRLHRREDLVVRLEEAGTPYREIAAAAGTVAHARSLHRVEDRISALDMARENLDTVAAELDGVDATGRAFVPIVRKWRDLVGSHAEQLLAGVRRQRLRNPYAVGAPVAGGFGVFVGRTEVAARIAEVLEADRPPPVLLLGESRIGKSSLLRNLPRLLAKGYVPCYTDLQHTSGVTDQGDVLSCIASDLLEDAERHHGSGLPKLSGRRLRRRPVAYFRRWVEDLGQMMAPRRLVLLVDEVEQLGNLGAAMDPSRLLDLFCSFNRPPLSFGLLFAGSRRVPEREWAEALRSPYSIELGHLRRDEAEELILRPTVDFSLRYTWAACERMILLSGCHPALLQRLCWEVVSGARLDSTNLLIGVEEVEAAAEKTLQSGTLLLRTLIESLSTEDRRFLRILAQRKDELGVGREPSRLLVHREILEVRKEGLRFKAVLLQRWLARMPNGRPSR